MNERTNTMNKWLGRLLICAMLISLIAPMANIVYAEPTEMDDPVLEESPVEEEPVDPGEDTPTEPEQPLDPSEPVEPGVPVETEEPQLPAPEEQEEPVVEPVGTDEENTETGEPTVPEEDYEEIVDENPDGLLSPFEPFGPIHLSVFSSVAAAKNASVRVRADLEPGEVRLSKTATPVPGMVNTWDMELVIEARKAETTSDIVLVIDRSSSMYGTPIANAKAAAIRFVERILATEDARARNRIAIVSFGNDQRLESDFSNNINDLKNAINGIPVRQNTDGTHTQSGLNQARTLLDTSGDRDLKTVVLLSDGEPTLSYQLRNPRTYMTNQYASGNYYYRYESISNIPEAAFNYAAKVGTGTNLRTLYERTGRGTSRDPYRYYYYNHGNSAIAESTIAKVNYPIYSIGFNVDDNGKSILQSIASPGKYYGSNLDGLDPIFEEIAGKLLAPVTDGVVEDPMGQGFTVIQDSINEITVSQGTYSYVNNKIDWTVGTMTPPEGEEIARATLKYRIEITDDILNVDPKPADGMYFTNGETPFHFTDYRGQSKTENFVVPKVDPVFLIVEKLLVDVNGQPLSHDKTFNITVTGPENFSESFSLKGGQNKISTKLRYVGSYKAGENLGAGFEDYILVSIVPETHQLTEQTEAGIDDVEFTVTNKYAPKRDVKVKKEVSGSLMDPTLPFPFTIKIGDADPIAFSLSGNDVAKLFEGIPAGTKITLTENPGNYELISVIVKDGNETVTLEPQEDGSYTYTLGLNNIEFIFTNKREGVVPTGNSLDQTPYTVMLSLVGLGALGLMMRKRFKTDF